MLSVGIGDGFDDVDEGGAFDEVVSELSVRRCA
jgi:hypothetical protein